MYLQLEIRKSLCIILKPNVLPELIINNAAFKYFVAEFDANPGLLNFCRFLISCPIYAMDNICKIF